MGPPGPKGEKVHLIYFTWNGLLYFERLSVRVNQRHLVTSLASSKTTNCSQVMGLLYTKDREKRFYALIEFVHHM